MTQTADNPEKLRVIAEWMGWEWSGLMELFWADRVRDNHPSMYRHLLPVWHKVRDALGALIPRSARLSSKQHIAVTLRANVKRALTDGSIQDLTDSLFSAIVFLKSIK